MNISNRINELFNQFEIALLNDQNVFNCIQYSDILNVSREIISFFGLPADIKFEHEFIEFAYGTDYTETSGQRIIEILTAVATQYLSESNTSASKVSDIFRFVLMGQVGDNCSETHNTVEEDDNILSQSLENAWQTIKSKREWENHLYSTGEKPKPIESEKVKDYVIKHLYLPMTAQEFTDIETGFGLRWNYSYGQMVGDNDLKRTVDQYLISIESPMDRRKMKKVVDLILEYLEEIGEWS